MPNGACIRGPNAWIHWQAARVVLRERLRQLEVDPYVHRDIVRGFRDSLDDLELAATQYRDWERARSAADSAEVSPSWRDAGSDRTTWVGTGFVARELACSRRWVSTLCVLGRLRATRVGREWQIETADLEDFKRRGVEAA